MLQRREIYRDVEFAKNALRSIDRPGIYQLNLTLGKRDPNHRLNQQSSFEPAPLLPPSKV